MCDTESGQKQWERVLENVTLGIRELNAYPDALMFRGQRKAEWQLVPSLFREIYADAKENESNLYQVFRTRGSHLLPKGLSDWETLTFMQHYRLPTRLLDWTDSFGVAVYFAVSEQSFDKPEDSAVWILDGMRLSKNSTGSDQIYSVAVETFHSYERYFVELDSKPAPEPWPHKIPVAIEAAWAHERLVAQRGFFTVHGTDKAPLDAQCPALVKKIVIPAAATEYARKFLRLAGIDHFRMFPDLEGLAHSLLDEYCTIDLERWRKLLSQ